MIHFYVDEVMSGRMSIKKGINRMVENVLDKTELWKDIKAYPYDCIGFETLYGLYWQLDELINDEIFIENGKKDKLILETEEEIKKEFISWENLKY